MSSSDSQVSRKSKTSLGSRASKKRRDIVVKSVVSFNAKQDEVLLRRVIDTCNIINPVVWSDLRKNRQNLFFNVKLSTMKTRVFQLAVELGGDSFNMNKDNLTKLQELIKWQQRNYNKYLMSRLSDRVEEEDE